MEHGGDTPPCSYLHVRPALGPSFTFTLDFDKIDNVLTEHVGLLHILPLAVHINFLSKWDPPFMLKSYR